MKEEKIWAIKDGFLVHRDGSIYKLNWRNTGTMRRIKQTNDGNGYLRFWCNGKMTRVHRFVAECFLPNLQNLPFINHKNEIKSDNRVINLEWCTAKYNTNYGTAKQRWAEKNKGSKRTEETRKKISESNKNNPKKSKKVLQFTKDWVFVKEWCSLREIERVLGYHHRNISKCCNGKQKSAYDYIWKCNDNLLA